MIGPRPKLNRGSRRRNVTDLTGDRSAMRAASEVAKYHRLEGGDVVAVRLIGPAPRWDPWAKRRENRWITNGSMVEIELRSGARHQFGGRACWHVAGNNGKAGTIYRNELAKRRRAANG